MGCSQGLAGGEALQEEPLKDHKKKNQPPVEGTTVLRISQVGVDSDPLGLLKCKLFGWSCRGPLAKLEVRKVGLSHPPPLVGGSARLSEEILQFPSKLYSDPFISSLWAG